MRRTLSLAQPSEPIPFDGERCTPWVTTHILAAHLHRYFSVLELTRGKRVLDISCGEGYGAALIHREGAACVTGADIDAVIIERATRVYGTDGLSFVLADARATLPFDDGAFDVVISFETIEHISEHSDFIAELVRVLVPDGILVVSTPDAALSPPDMPNPFHAKELNENDFLGLLRTRFAHVTPYRQGYLHGSVLSGPGGDVQSWKRSGFLDYAEDDETQRRYILAVATNGPRATLPTGMLHDGAIVATLNRRIEALEAKVREFEASGAKNPEGADET